MLVCTDTLAYSHLYTYTPHVLIYLNAHAHTHVHSRVYTYPHTSHLYTLAHTLYTCSTSIYTHSHTHEHTHTHTQTRAYTRSHMHTHTTLLYMLMHTYACTCTQYTFRKLCAWLSCIRWGVLLSQECHVVEGELEIQLELLLFSPCARREVFTLGYVPTLGGQGELSALGHIILSLCVEFL